MKRQFLIIILIGVCGICSCVDQPSPAVKKAGETEDRFKDSSTAFTLDERLKAADSLVLVFYKDPYGSDSLRYTRYYKQTSIVSGFDTLNQQLSFKHAQEPLRKCRTEGKIWCFTKGKVFQTIYFSTRTPACSFTYLIKDGDFYYAGISQEFITWLTNAKSRAIELPNEALKAE